MSDIVDRLRTDVLWHKRRFNETIAEDCREAADEIDRLRAEVEALQDSCEAKSDRIDRLGERVEKDTALLRQALDSMHPAMQAWAGTCAWHGPLKEAIAALRERLGDTAMAQEK